jgi:hypothetical protein
MADETIPGADETIFVAREDGYKCNQRRRAAKAHDRGLS